MLIEFLCFLKDYAQCDFAQEIIDYFIKIRENSKLTDSIMLSFITFITSYLLMFRFRICLIFESKKANRKRGRKKKQIPNKETENETLVQWLYMVKNRSYCNYKKTHPTMSKVIFIYNAYFVSIYFIQLILLPIALIFHALGNLYIDINFINIYINVIPLSVYCFVRYIYDKIKS